MMNADEPREFRAGASVTEEVDEIEQHRRGRVVFNMGHLLPHGRPPSAQRMEHLPQSAYLLSSTAS